MCDFCDLLLVGPPFPLPNVRINVLQHHITCQTQGVIYIIFCQCGTFYVGKTIRPFWRRIKDHVYYATSGLLNTTMGYRIAFKHKFNPMVFKFAALDVIHVDHRGGNFDKRILQRETQWIHKLRATVYPGLNNTMRPFL